MHTCTHSRRGKGSKKKKERQYSVCGEKEAGEAGGKSADTRAHVITRLCAFDRGPALHAHKRDDAEDKPVLCPRLFLSPPTLSVSTGFPASPGTAALVAVTPPFRSSPGIQTPRALFTTARLLGVYVNKKRARRSNLATAHAPLSHPGL